jgi:RND family efflux transporter MFP subunit
MSITNSRTIKRKKQKRNRLIASAIVVLILASASYYYTQFYGMEESAVQEPALQTAKVRTGDIVISVDGIGEILPLDDVAVGFQSNGIISSIPVSVGDYVEEGQILARLDDSSTSLQLEQANLNWLAMTSPQAIAEAELKVFLTQDQVTLAEENLKYLVSPSVYHWEIEVAGIQKLLDSYQNDDQTEQETIEAAQNELLIAQGNLEQAQYLYKTAYLPENFAYTYIDSETGLEALNADTGELLLNQVPPTSNEISLARATLRDKQLALQEAQAYEALLKGEVIPENSETMASGNTITQYEQAKLAIESAELAIENTILRAPISGTVTAINAREGQSSGTNPIIEIKSIEKMVLSFYLEESALPYISAGKRLTARFDAYPDLEFKGEVINIDPSLTTKDGELVIHGWATLEISEGIQLLSLMTADVQIIAAEANDTLVVPLQAVRELAPGSYSVFVVAEDQSLEMRIVTIGIKDFANAEILSGLTKGEVVSTGTVETAQ